MFRLRLVHSAGEVNPEAGTFLPKSRRQKAQPASFPLKTQRPRASGNRRWGTRGEGGVFLASSHRLLQGILGNYAADQCRQTNEEMGGWATVRRLEAQREGRRSGSSETPAATVTTLTPRIRSCVRLRCQAGRLDEPPRFRIARCGENSRVSRGCGSVEAPRPVPQAHG